MSVLYIFLYYTRILAYIQHNGDVSLEEFRMFVTTSREMFLHKVSWFILLTDCGLSAVGRAIHTVERQSSND